MHALLCVHSSFTIISMGKRELVALLCLSSWCLVINCCVALPHDATGLSAVYDCGISRSYSLTSFDQLGLICDPLMISKDKKIYITYTAMMGRKTIYRRHTVPLTSCINKKMAKIRKLYNQVPHLTNDTTCESNKIYNKHPQQEPRGQPFPSR